MNHHARKRFARHVRPHTSKLHHNHWLSGAAALTVIAIAVSGQSLTHTLASWNDSEWVRSTPIASTDCEAPEGFANRAEAQMVSASVLGTDLAELVEVNPVTVTSNGSGLVGTGEPVSSPNNSTHSYRTDSVDASLISALNIDLGEFTQLPLDTGVGVLGQFGQSHPQGQNRAATGLISDQGAVAFAEPAGGYPTLATFQLSDTLNALAPSAGTALSGVADVALEIGAVSAEAELKGCESVWSGDSQARARMVHRVNSDVVAGLSRDSAVAGVNLVVRSDALGELVTSIIGSSDSTCTSTNGALLPLLVGLECELNTLNSVIVPIMNTAFSTDSTGGLAGYNFEVDPATLNIGTNLDFSELQAELIDSPIMGEKTARFQ